MAQPSTSHVDLLVVGVGPTGLTAALEARRFGMTVRIVDKRDSRARRSKALVIHARTMEILDNLGLAPDLMRRGVRFAGLNLHGAGGARGRLDLMGLDWGDTDYPFWLTLPQYETEQVLEDALAAEGVHVEWDTELSDLSQDDSGVAATLGGRSVTADWLIGADGSHSAVRGAVGGHLERVDAGATFILADVHTTNRDLVQDEGHLYLHPDGLLIIVPMPEPDLWRIIAHRPGESPDNDEPIDAAFLDALVRERAGVEFGAHDVGWTSRFALAHGVTDVIRRDRVFLAGDAVHVHSPVGGQGLNTGVQDAHNLIWKLAAARALGDNPHGRWLLGTYGVERMQVAEEMVGSVDRATRILTGRTGLVRRAVGAVMPRTLPRLPVRQAFGRRLAGLELAYEGEAAGRRLPNHPTADGSGVLAHLDPRGFTWVLNGADEPFDARGLPVIHVGDGPAVTLVRPDGYVAATGDSAEETIARVRPALWAAAQALAR